MKAKIAIFCVAAAICLSALAVMGLEIKSHEKTTVVTNFAQPTSGFWKNITVEDEEGKEVISSPAFFCKDGGNYQSHVVDSKQGWWVLYVGDKKIGSYASEDFAKREAESRAECK